MLKYSNSIADLDYLIYLSISFKIKLSYDRFVDERVLTSRDALNNFQMKIKLVAIDDNARDHSVRFGRRVLVDKIILLSKHTETQEIEEIELDIAELEKRIRKERHYSSSNRWISPNEIKNGYIVASRHQDLLSDAVALGEIVFE